MHHHFSDDEEEEEEDPEALIDVAELNIPNIEPAIDVFNTEGISNVEGGAPD